MCQVHCLDCTRTAHPAAGNLDSTPNTHPTSMCYCKADHQARSRPASNSSWDNKQDTVLPGGSYSQGHEGFPLSVCTSPLDQQRIHCSIVCKYQLQHCSSCSMGRWADSMHPPCSTPQSIPCRHHRKQNSCRKWLVYPGPNPNLNAQPLLPWCLKSFQSKYFYLIDREPPGMSDCLFGYWGPQQGHLVWQLCGSTGHELPSIYRPSTLILPCHSKSRQYWYILACIAGTSPSRPVSHNCQRIRYQGCTCTHWTDGCSGTAYILHLQGLPIHNSPAGPRIAHPRD